MSMCLVSLVIAAVTFVAVGPLRLNTPLVVVVMTAVGLWLNRPGGGRPSAEDPP